MLKTLWNSFNAPKTDNAAGAALFDRARLKLLIEHFPIGRKLRYYPEYQREIMPDFDSLVLTDKRRKQRVQAAVQAELYLAPDATPFPCVLGDFSERSLRLRVSGTSEAMPTMEPADQVVIEFNLGDATSLCRFRGKVFRRTDDFCVIDIEHLYKSGGFESVGSMDIMEIKTRLLNLYS